jgi:hypothetical protein
MFENFSDFDWIIYVMVLIIIGKRLFKRAQAPLSLIAPENKNDIHSKYFKFALLAIFHMTVFTFLFLLLFYGNLICFLLMLVLIFLFRKHYRDLIQKS